VGLPVPTTRTRARLAGAAPMLTLAVWLLALPLRILFALGLRRAVALVCVLVLTVTAYGVAEDLGLLQPPARAAPAHRKPARNPATGQPAPTRAATADIPAGYLRLYRAAGARYQVPWSVLAAIGKVESDHGRSPLPGVRSGSNWAGACGPMQLACVPGSKAGNAWARYGHGRPHDPAQAIPAAARYLVDHGARRNLDRALFAYNHSWPYVAKVKQLAHRYAAHRGGRR
jgi:membrane-bound lytic murein transglycosylase B